LLNLIVVFDELELHLIDVPVRLFDCISMKPGFYTNCCGVGLKEVKVKLIELRYFLGNYLKSSILVHVHE